VELRDTFVFSVLQIGWRSSTAVKRYGMAVKRRFRLASCLFLIRLWLDAGMPPMTLRCRQPKGKLSEGKLPGGELNVGFMISK
jgi:hypothetical protein